MAESMRKIVYYENVLEFTENSRGTLKLSDVNNWELCRLCLSEVGAGELDRMCIIGLDGSFMSVTEILRLTTGQSISSSDRLPHRICKDCLNKISSLYFFQMQVRRAEVVLNRLLVKLHLAPATSEAQPSSSAELAGSVVDTTTGDCSSSTGLYPHEDETSSSESAHKQMPQEEIEDDLPPKTEEEYQQEEIIEMDNYQRQQPARQADQDQAETEHEAEHNPPADDDDDDDGIEIVQLAEQEDTTVDEQVEEVLLDSTEGEDVEVAEEFYLDGETESHNEEELLRLNATKTGIATANRSASQSCVDNEEDIDSQDSQSLEVPEADMTFVEMEVYPRTRRPRQMPEKLSCSLCHEVFSKQNLLIDHCSTEHPNSKPFKCDLCASTFVHMQSLSRHRMIHTPDAYNMTCTYCDKQFIRRDDWRRHMRIHTGQRPYPCDKCDKAFKQPSELKDHQLTHIAEKRYACDLCNHRLSSRNGLYLHKKVHAGIKRHVCLQCADEGKVRRFITAGELRSHMRIHVKQQKLLHMACEEEEEGEVDTGLVEAEGEAAMETAENETITLSEPEEDEEGE